MSVSDADLVAALGGHVARLARRPSPFATSHALEEVDAELPSGERLALILKRLGDDALHESARAAKPDFLRDPRREIEVYEHVLADAGLGTPRCYGSGPDWLLLERVAGMELRFVGERATWERAAGWLAGMHARLRPGGATRLLRHDRASLARWAERAARNAPEVEGVAARHPALADRLDAQPTAVLHGELYPSNVLVAGDRICPIDWEVAAVGPALLDLAALTAGRGWSEADRRAIALAYRDALADPPDEDAFLADLDAARLYAALQWLGWATEAWRPPRAHRNDWTAEALEAAARLGV
jgi:thiamine kinase-like enzyme